MNLVLVASRALSSKAAPLAGEGSTGWCALWRQGCARYSSSPDCLAAEAADSLPSSSCTADHASSAVSLQRSGQQRASPSTDSLYASFWGKTPWASPFINPSSCAVTMPRTLHLSTAHRPVAWVAVSHRELHEGNAAVAPAAGGGREPSVPPSSDTAPRTSSSSSSSPAPPPVQNPLQAALFAAAGGQSATQQRGRPGGVEPSGRLRQKRTWMWYDEDDEREERRYERAREQYNNVGTAYMSNITQSVKKMNRIVRLVRGLSYADAVAQCQMVPHKAARYVLQALEAAFQDATQAVGLKGERLVVGLIYATRGRVEKAMQRMGRGRSGRMYTRTSHLRVVLRETREASSGLKMRRVATLMSVMTGATAPRVAAWLTARGSPAAVRAAARPRFAYRVEV